jgi:hypothetical protein
MVEEHEFSFSGLLHHILTLILIIDIGSRAKFKKQLLRILVYKLFSNFLLKCFCYSTTPYAPYAPHLFLNIPY